MKQTKSSCSDTEEEYEVEKIVGMCESKVYPFLFHGLTDVYAAV